MAQYILIGRYCFCQYLPKFLLLVYFSLFPQGTQETYLASAMTPTQLVCTALESPWDLGSHCESRISALTTSFLLMSRYGPPGRRWCPWQ